MIKKFFQIKFGNTRIVFLVGNQAIKIPGKCFFNGIKANRREAFYPKDCRVCPVIASFLFGTIIIMPRADKIASWEDWENLEYNNYSDITEDIWPKNLGWFSNKLKVIDYGKP